MDMDSDSDFYGDQETISKLEARVNGFDVEKGWENHQSFTDRISHDDPFSSGATGQLHNMFQGHPGAWQLTETVDSFLARLPPSSTQRSSQIDWIRIANPFVPPRDRELMGTFKDGGRERLDMLSRFIAASNASGLPLLRIKREIQKERDETVKDLQDLAVVTKLLSGKWMLFPEPQDVDEAWNRVARATANNELGICAKVEAVSDSLDKQRLICVYTSDFQDKNDIARVLNKMRELGLIRAGGRQIYYKSDAWTELGIYGGNDWQIGASMYSSNEIFAYIKNHGLRW